MENQHKDKTMKGWRKAAIIGLGGLVGIVGSASLSGCDTLYAMRAIDAINHGALNDPVRRYGNDNYCILSEGWHIVSETEKEYEIEKIYFNGESGGKRIITKESIKKSCGTTELRSEPSMLDGWGGRWF